MLLGRERGRFPRVQIVENLETKNLDIFVQQHQKPLGFGFAVGDRR
ncbi:hypothetical protein [Thiocystis violascens]|nr:hypothetical protein [Thiocystis violascens]